MNVLFADKMPKDSKDDEKVYEPSFEPSGKLAADTNTFKGVVIKYNEPPEAAQPKLRWRLYPIKVYFLFLASLSVQMRFSGQRDAAANLHPSANGISRWTRSQNCRCARANMFRICNYKKSCHNQYKWLVFLDFPVDHPSCSKQHAVFQYRSVPFERDGVAGRRTLLYLIDLASANGTYINDERVEAQRYYELKEKDSIRFVCSLAASVSSTGAKCLQVRLLDARIHSFARVFV